MHSPKGVESSIGRVVVFRYTARIAHARPGRLIRALFDKRGSRVSREIRIPAGIHPDQRWLRHRVGQRVALPLHRWRVRRGGVRAHVPAVLSGVRAAYPGDGVRGGARQPEGHRAQL